jgi:peptidyl-prolyl cis-trans isomerase C
MFFQESGTMRHTATLTAAICASAVFLHGCNSKGNASGGGSDASLGTTRASARLDVKTADPLATVNGRPIPRSAVPRQHRPGPPAASDKMRDELVQRELLRQEAEKLNLLADPAVAEKVDNALRMAVSQTAAEYFIEHQAPTDEEIRLAYEEKSAPMKKTEYRLRHIVVASEAAARDVIAQLQKGEKFEDLAKKLSTDIASKAQGGELGWQTQDRLAAPVSAVLAGLKNGELASVPVQTAAGWEVVQREDFREKQPPAFEQMKDQIVRGLQVKKFQQHVDALKAAAKIDMPAPPPHTAVPSASPLPGSPQPMKP